MHSQCLMEMFKITENNNMPYFWYISHFFRVHDVFQKYTNQLMIVTTEQNMYKL